MCFAKISSQSVAGLFIFLIIPLEKQTLLISMKFPWHFFILLLCMFSLPLWTAGPLKAETVSLSTASCSTQLGARHPVSTQPKLAD